MDRLAGAPRRERARRVALPVLTLPPDLGNLGRAVPLGDTAERRAGLDRLQLLGVAYHDDLGTGVGAWPSTRSIWRVPIIPASSRTSTSLGPSCSRPWPHACSRLAIVRDVMPEPALKVLRRDAGQGCAAHRVALPLPRLARDAEHRRLAAAGVADDGRQPGAAGDMIEGVALLGRKDKPLGAGRVDRGVTVPIADAMPGATRQLVAGPLKPGFPSRSCRADVNRSWSRPSFPNATSSELPRTAPITWSN